MFGIEKRIGNSVIGSQTRNNDRVIWVDVARIIGMYLIWVGHFRNDDSWFLCNFVWRFHVPLLFFIAGCSESLSKRNNIRDSIIRDVKKILIPFYLFGSIYAIIHIALRIVKNDYGSQRDLILIIKDDFLQLLLGGIRNHFVGGTLWFLTCLFVIKLLFYCLRVLIKNKWIMLGVVYVLQVVWSLLDFPTSATLPYNIDSAISYFIYFALGFTLFNLINLIWVKVNDKDTFKSGIVRLIFLIVVLGTHTLLTALGYTIPSSSVSFVARVVSIINTVGIIMLVVVIAMLLSVMNVGLLSDMGRESIYYCAFEGYYKKLFATVFIPFGLNFTYTNEMGSLIWLFLCMIACRFTLIPILKRVYRI